MTVSMLLFGFLVPGIDNWAHLGGLGGGWLAARWLDPLRPERGDHLIAAVACLLLSLASVVASVVTGAARPAEPLPSSHNFTWATRSRNAPDRIF